MDLDEQKLVNRLNQGDEKAFDALFYRYHVKIFNLAKRFLSRKEDAEEVVQSVFIALWENRATIDESKSLTGYLLTVARHIIYNTLRKNVYRQGYIEYIMTQNHSVDFVTENEVLFHDLNNLVTSLVDQLPPKRKEIFRLSRYDGLSYQEIARKLSISESTVNSQLTKALDYIRKNI
jgi:RNA polymerase sigma-70 factor, ECF subfamily